MTLIRQLCTHLESIAPTHLAESWDNVGLLVGDGQRAAQRVMTCLTMTPASVAEAIERQADLVVTHHPLPFRPLKRVTTDDTVGRMLWQLVGAHISVYSPHTAWDSARSGINQQLAKGLGLIDIRPLKPNTDDPDDLGSGRSGSWPQPSTLQEVTQQVKEFLSLEHLQYVGKRDQPIQHVAIACGSAGSFLEAAHDAGCQLLLTGETGFHTCLEATARGVALVLPGHYASERFSLEALASCLQQDFPDLEIWSSRREVDPLQWA